ncbi:metal-sensing transcriptional repressor [Asaia bogorensis]|uniref:metal-sensing transcriptional repressor n=1 Tax=Asaia bogorensis TaxID=91915 RepID=UPI001FCAED27|nr:metal-sensing transcriptional repressor [Asaia bogorensis]
MVDEDRYCVDVLLQLRAAKAALHRLEGLVLCANISRAASWRRSNPAIRWNVRKRSGN